jgi:hypothetical protein
LFDGRFSNSILGTALQNIGANNANNNKPDEASNMIPSNSFLGLSRMGSLPYLGPIGTALSN